jgi:hypothetical protein
MSRLTTSRVLQYGIIFGISLFSFVQISYATQISNVQIANIKSDSAEITWTTDKESDSTINYGLNDSFGIVREGALSTKHLLTIDDLDPSTTYYFRVVSADADGNTSATAGFQFTTKGKTNIDRIINEIKKVINPEDLKKIQETVQEQQTDQIKPPSIVGSPKVIPNEGGATITWSTDRDADSHVFLAPEGEYNPNSANPYTIDQGDAKEATQKHVVNVIGLEPATVYHYSVSSTDLAGLTGTSEDDTFETKAAIPIVQNIKVTKVQENSATVSWTTPVLAKGVVSYTNLRTKATKSAGSPVFAANQSINLTGLEFGTRYSAVISATNKAGDNFDSKPFSFITVRDVVPPVIAKVKNESTLFPGEDSKVQTIISWLTDEPSNCQVYYTQGLIREADSESDSLPKETNPLTDHTQVIVGFVPGTVYKFWLTCDDVAGNESQSEDYVLITPIKEKNIIDIILENFQGTFGWVNKIGK